MSHRRRTSDRRRAPRFVPAVFDRLEDRLALSHAAAGAAHVRAAPASPPAATTNLPAQLAAANAQINQAYATFAETVRAAELNAFSLTSVGVTTISNDPTVPTNTDISSNLNISPATLPAVTAAVDTLERSITAALDAVPLAARGAGLIAAGINGPGLGSLSGQLTALVAEIQHEAYGKDGPVPTSTPPPDSKVTTTTPTAPITTTTPTTPIPGVVGVASLPQLFSAVEGAMAASYNATAVQVYLAALPASGGGEFATPINAAYSTLANTIQQAQLPAIDIPRADIRSRPGFDAIGATFATAVRSLGTTLGSSLPAAVAPALPLIQSQVAGAIPGSLLAQINQAVAVAANPRLPLYVYGLFNVTLLAALQASYNATAIEAALIASA